MLDFHQDLYNERFQGEGFPDWAVQDDGLPASPQLGFPANYLVMPALWRAFDHFWDNAPGPGGVGLQDRYAEAFRVVAERFRGDPSVMGYDIFNEPWPGSGYLSCIPLGCPAFDAKLTAFSRRVAAAIRRADRDGLVWYEPHVLFNNGVDTHMGEVDPRAGFSFHDYCLGEGPNPSQAGDAVQRAFCGPFDRLVWENASRRADEFGDPLMLSEFGATNDLGVIGGMADRADAAFASWQYWHYCQCADPTTAGVGGTQELVIDLTKPPTGANVRGDKLDTLARAYPQAIAGTPRRLRFDAATRRLELSFTTARTGGGAFAFGADTQVFVPRRRYPGGYDVRVEGAEPLSAPGAQELRLRTCAGRGRVTLTLAPGSGRRTADCRAPRRPPARLRLSVSPRTAVAGRSTRFVLRVTVRSGRRVRGIRGARIRFAGRLLRTDRAGRARIRLTLRRAGRVRARATRSGARPASATVRVRRR
jgi:endoglycosylceramidase